MSHRRGQSCSSILNLANSQVWDARLYYTCLPCGPGNNIILHFGVEDRRNAVHSPEDPVREWVQSVLWRWSPFRIPERAPQYSKGNDVNVNNEAESLKLPRRMSPIQLVEKLCYIHVRDNEQQDQPTTSICRTGTSTTLHHLTYHLQIDVCATYRESYSVLISQHVTQTSASIAKSYFPSKLAVVSWSPFPIPFLFHCHKRDVRALAEWAQFS